MKRKESNGVKGSYRTLSSTDFLRFEICWFLLDWSAAAAAATTATMRNRWIGGKRFQARASSGVKPPPMVLAELASSALTSRPWRDIHAIGFSDETGRLRSRKVVERRRRRLEEKGGRDTRHGKGNGEDASPLGSYMALHWKSDFKRRTFKKNWVSEGKEDEGCIRSVNTLFLSLLFIYFKFFYWSY